MSNFKLYTDSLIRRVIDLLKEGEGVSSNFEIKNRGSLEAVAVNELK